MMLALQYLKNNINQSESKKRKNVKKLNIIYKILYIMILITLNRIQDY